MHYYCLVAALSLTLLASTGCDANPSHISDNPATQVPLSPEPPAPADTVQALTLGAALNGHYADSLQIADGKWSHIGPRQMVELTFVATGLEGIGQFEMVISPDPPVDFDLQLSRFEPVAPFVTLGNGIEKTGKDGIRFIGVNFERTSNGTAVLGTLYLRTPPDFSDTLKVRLPVTFFSIGPMSTQRDAYTGDELHLGVIVNSR